MTTFRQAVDLTPDLTGAWQPGLRALGSGRRHVTANDTRSLAGSVNIEGSLKRKLANSRLWDYAVGHKPLNFRGEVVYWIEVHPAYDHEIKVVKEKLKSLVEWLRASAPELDAMEGEFVWVSSGDTSFTKRGTQVRQLANEGLIFKGGVFRIPEHFGSDEFQ
jgi:hypothetical protein